MSLQYNDFREQGGTTEIASKVAERAQWAEAVGFHTFFMLDHLFQVPNVGPADEPMLEVFSTLSYVAGKTSTIKLGQMVLGVTYRQPGLLIKEATTLDVLSGGRTYFGIGAAWFEREHLGLGLAFPPVKERFERLEETLQIAKQMWSDNNGPYNGTHYQLAETITSPQPLSAPHPPILIGGAGEKKTLKLVAQYADASNINLTEGVDGLKRKLAILREHCDTVGRDYAEIEKTSNGGVLPLSKSGVEGTMSPEQAIDLLGQLKEAGVTQALIGLKTTFSDESRELIATELIPAAAKL
ncbi:MAG: LLM class F420-dependent oxidoreductase [Thermomicrobiales bacterium]